MLNQNSELLNRVFLFSTLAVDCIFIGTPIFATVYKSGWQLLFSAALVVPLILAIAQRRLQLPSRSLLLFGSISFFYILMCHLMVIYYNGLGVGSELYDHISIKYFYLVAIPYLLLTILRISTMNDIFRTLRITTPAILSIVFILLSYEMFKSSTDSCRIPGQTNSVFHPAMFFSMFTLLFFIGWSQLSRVERLIRYLFLALSLVVVFGYTAARSIGVAFGFSVIGFLLFFLFGRERNSVPTPTGILLSCVLGLLLCLFIELQTGCPVFIRFSQLSQAVVLLGEQFLSDPLKASIKTAADLSISIRLNMWHDGWNSFLESPLFGHGIFYEIPLFSDSYGYKHAHNQYLSWLIWGGIPMLVLGLIFLLSPVIILGKAITFDRFVVILATTIMMSIAIIFDSFLRIDMFLYLFVFVTLIGLRFLENGK